jgi:hypothetical protein
MAGLPTAEPRVTGVLRVGVAPHDPSITFVNDAEGFLDTRQFEYAVLSAGIACELEVRITLEVLMGAECGTLGTDLLEVLRPRSYTLLDAAIQRAFKLSGYRCTDEQWWNSYRALVERRNNVAHRGAEVAETDAHESVDAMWQVVNFMRSARQRARPTQPQQ